MSNHRRYKNGLEYLFTDSLTGFKLYALPGYPYAVKTGDPNDVITVEVHRAIDHAAEQAIHNLEIGVGYVYDEVLVREQVVGIYLFEKAGTEPLVEGGDWVKFFGSR
jgi:gamma-glutamylcyclotransferase (GGCT)/AIG2-like uncharacterized protein YtfP